MLSYFNMGNNRCFVVIVGCFLATAIFILDSPWTRGNSILPVRVPKEEIEANKDPTLRGNQSRPYQLSPERRWVNGTDEGASIGATRPRDLASWLSEPVPLRHWVNESDSGASIGETNASNTHYRVLNKGPIFKGDTVYVRIEARDRYNQLRFVGGDFWFTTMASSKAPVASIAGTVTDYNNGTYLVRFLAAWSGYGNISIILVHPSDATEFLKDTFWVAEGKILWTAKFKSETKTELSRCSIKSPGIWEKKCIYPRPIAMGRSSFICDKPKSLPCSSIAETRIDNKGISSRTAELIKDVKFLFDDDNYVQKISGNIETLQLQDSSTTIRADNLPMCHPRMPLASPKGYWLEHKWYPLNCRKFKCWSNATQVGECLRNKLVLALGDSNARQWADQLLGLVYGKRQPPGGGLYTHQYVETFNISIDFHFHQTFISSRWLPYTSESPAEYETDMLDRSTDPECNYVIFISTWSHFAQWTRKAFTERLLLMREAVERFQNRCPSAPVFLKSPHPREHKNLESRIWGSDFILNELRKLTRKIFADTGVFFIDTWDLTLAYPTNNRIHMPVSLIQQELAMILAGVCDDSLCEE